MTTDNSLTQRYLGVVLSRIPAGKRDDVERELRSSIADAVDDRIAGGQSPDLAERSALEAMGDPSMLAGSLTGRTNYLIGPALFGRYRDMLLLLLGTLAPIIGVIVAVFEFLRTGQIGPAIGSAVGSVVNFIVWTVFWLTVVFAALERTEAVTKIEAKEAGQAGKWTVDQLPVIKTSQPSVGDTFEGVLTVGIGIVGLIVLPHLTYADPASGQAVPFLAPALSDFWIPALLGLLVIELGFHLYAFVRGWTLLAAALYAIPQLLVAVSLVYLALNGLIVNPAFAQAINFPPLAQAGSPGMVIFAVFVVAVTAIEIFKTFRRAMRSTDTTSASSQS